MAGGLTSTLATSMSFRFTKCQLLEPSAIGHRRVDHYCQGGYGEEERYRTIIKALGDCVAVLVAKIGACPRNDLAAAWFVAVDSYPYEDIKTAELFPRLCAARAGRRSTT